MDKVKTLNLTAILCLVVGKISGITELALSYVGLKTLGGSLLIVDGAGIIASLVLCFLAARTTAKQEELDKDIVARLMKEGTLKHYVRELERIEREQQRDQDLAA